MGLYTLALRTDHSVMCAPHACDRHVSFLSYLPQQQHNGVDTNDMMVTAAPQLWPTRMEIGGRPLSGELNKPFEMSCFDSFGP